jgi:cell wall-associated NlpC family hydrolase
MRKEPRLHFTDEERADPALEKPIRKADRAAAKADKAQAKIPKKQVRQKTVDPKTGKVTTKLVLEDKKKPPSKLSHAVRDAPGDAALGKLHKEIRETEQDNVGVESAHKSEEAVETGVRLFREGYRSHKLKPYRKAAQAEQKLEKANVNALYQKSLRENPQLTSNSFSRWQQKQAIKKEYAAAKAGNGARNTVKASETTAKAAKRAAEGSKKAGSFFVRHKKGFLIAGGIAAAILLLITCISSCSTLFQGGVSGIVSSTYPLEDADMLAAEAAYCAMEDELREYLNSYERTHDYDEYHFDLDEIEHDPYVLISMITALKGGEWTIDEIGGVLETLFEKQYILTETVATETRYRTETHIGYYTDENGNLQSYEYEVEVPYTYYICTVTLENFNLSHVPVHIMSHDQLSMYAVYMSVLGNRPDLFPGSPYVNRYYHTQYEKYEIPPEALADEQFAAIIKEAEKYLGYPYIWGGSTPATSFDCSGFVSYVYNNCGLHWSFGRLGAEGLRGMCAYVSPESARPGDLIFFEKTYDTAGASHVGIYVGNNRMLHCGDPIHYASIDTSYWRSHFLQFGRLP